jgi:phosphatidylserine/phosphatidylglycerophosphate/cardiolipin synthase-like enzyme
MNQAVAFSNNDVSLVIWRYDQRIPGCLGFAIHRIDELNVREVLPAWIGFQGQSNADWQPQTTEIWPVQKFSWRDLTCQRGKTYRYDIVPMIGSPGNLTANSALTLSTNPVDLTPARGSVSAYFNRGILSTQYLAHQIPPGPSGSPNYLVLRDRIDQPGDPLRNSLAGQIIEAMKSLLLRAVAEGGQCYCALYELNDPELVQALIANPSVHLILSNTGTDDAENQPARQSLHESGTDVIDRMLGDQHIGHNKFVVYVDTNGQPQAVLSGSTNWTYTALCGQSNNVLIIESPQLAELYFDYWQRLRADQAQQDATFRSANNKLRSVAIDAHDTDLWFSPNTKQKTKPYNNPPQPGDMKEVFDLIGAAQQGILFLVFQPGAPSIMDAVLKKQNSSPGLFVRGAATDAGAVDLYHRGSTQPNTVVAATAITDQFSFWGQELLKSSPGAHAIIHDKIVVIDPLSPNCVVVTGSHNLGYRASYNNDENLLIFKGHTALAAAYAVHVMDIYDHYRWRYLVQLYGPNAWSGLSPQDTWQDKYFSQAMQQEMKFWF